MISKNLYLFKKICVFVFLFISSHCFADTLYLNNGKIIKGKILEETDKYIKVDVVGVPITFFKNEIKKVDREKKEGLLNIKKGSAAERYLMYLQSLSLANDIRGIEEFIVSKNFKEMQQVTTDISYAKLLGTIPFLTPGVGDIDSLQEECIDDTVVLTILARQESIKGNVKMVKEEGVWKIEKEIWEENVSKIVPVPKSEIAEQKQNFGSISGVVYLPQTEQKGNLYIYFIPFSNIQTFGSRNYGKVIKRDDIISDKVSFIVENLPAGRYFGFVTWDLAEPFCDEKGFMCPGFIGDYTGRFLDEISVTEGQIIENINLTHLDFHKPINLEDYSTNYKITGLYYKKDALGKGHFMLTIKNLDRKPVRSVSVNCKINEEEAPGFFASSPSSLIDAGQETEFNITNCFQNYFAKLERNKQIESASKLLRVIISSKDNGSVFKTTIDGKNLDYKVSTKTYGGQEYYDITFH